MSKTELDPKFSIPAFYAGRSVFVTGATGFLGKVLVEKLLRSCPDVREIFLLMRPKKNKSIDDRLKEMLSLPLYDRLREERPSALEKLIPVLGNTASEGLGLPPVERQVIIERVSIVFHVAANVRFDDSLKDAVFTNTRSTRDVCILAGSMKKLVALVHVSSTYTQADKPEVDEILYPAEVDWKRTIKVAETVDDHSLRILTAKYLGAMPNTYTFTKRLAEDIINDYSKVLPCVVYRPSIVISAVQEPMEGWLDNFNGPVGMMVGGGKGILRVVYINPDVSEDFIPVDVAIKGMIIAAWKRGLKTITQDPTAHVYNCSSHDMRSISLQELIAMALRDTADLPLEGIVWYPNTWIIANRNLFYVMMLLLHLLPALLIDTLLKLSGARPMLVRIQRRVYISNSCLEYFLHNEWKFRNDKLLKLLTDDLPPKDYDAFGFDYTSFDIRNYFEKCLYGAKRYLLKEDMNNLDNARKHYNRMWMLDRIFKVWLGIAVTWLLYRAGFFLYIWTKFNAAINGTLFDDWQ